MARRESSRRALAIGSWAAVFGAVLCALPLLLGRWGLNKYLVAVGVLAMFVGINCIIFSAWDVLLRKR